MQSHMGLLPQCPCVVRSRAKVSRREESYAGRASQRLPWVMVLVHKLTEQTFAWF